MAAIVVVVVALAVALFALTRPQGPTPHPTPSPQATSTATPAWGTAFESKDRRLKGHWQILAHEWTGTTLRLQVRLAVDEGSMDPTFFIYPADSTDPIDPLSSSDFPGLDGKSLKRGDDRTGWLEFPMEHAQGVLVLGDYWYEQLAGLPVPT